MSALAQSTYSKYFGLNEWGSESSDFETESIGFKNVDEYQQCLELIRRNSQPFTSERSHDLVWSATMDALEASDFALIGYQNNRKLSALSAFEKIKDWVLNGYPNSSHESLHRIRKSIGGVSVIRAVDTSICARDASSLEAIFVEQAERWKTATEFTSSMAEIVSHPAYQRIIGLGPSVIGLILRDLEVNGAHWFSALVALTGENPVQKEDIGRYRKMKEAWLNWGRNKGLIQTIS